MESCPRSRHCIASYPFIPIAQDDPRPLYHPDYNKTSKTTDRIISTGRWHAGGAVVHIHSQSLSRVMFVFSTRVLGSAPFLLSSLGSLDVVTTCSSSGLAASLQFSLFFAPCSTLPMTRSYSAVPRLPCISSISSFICIAVYLFANAILASTGLAGGCCS